MASLHNPFNRIKPPGYVTASTLISIGGLLNGFDTGSIGAVTEMPQFVRTFGHSTPFMRGFTVSLIMLAGAFPGFFAGQLADRFGRLRITVCGALVFVLGAALEGGAYHLPVFLAGRTLCGLGQGLWLSNVSVYICEIAPSARRGMLVSTPQLMCTAGICAGYFTCFGAVRMDSTMAWRIPYVVQAAGGLLFAAACCFLPESPRWLLLNHHRDEAMRNLERLDFSRTEAEKDFLNASEQAALSKSAMEGFLLLFRRKYRARTVLALFVLGMVQLSGIDGVLYFAPTLFAQAGLPNQTASFLASGVSAILMLAISIPAFLLADKWGRRTSAISGGLALSSCMIVIGSLYAARVVHADGAGRWFVIVLIFAFALTYCFTWGVVGKIYASEIQPANTRAAANCLAQGLSFFTNWLVAIITPVLLASSSFGAYFLFGFLALGTVAVLAACMPETRSLSLESIQDAFQNPPMRSSLYHLRRTFFRSSARPASDTPVQDATELTTFEDAEAATVSLSIQVPTILRTA